MTLLFYDSTFEGFLTAIFEIYEFKYQNASILKHTTQQKTFFATSTTVVTNKEKSDRVIKRLEKQLGKNGVRELLFVYFSENEAAEKILTEVIFYAIANPTKNILQDYANQYVLQFSKIVKSVGREKHRMEAFVRFELLKDDVYFAKINPDFNVLPLITRHFKERYQDQKWIIYDIMRNYGVYYNLHSIEIIELPDFDSNTNELLHNNELNYQKLWIEYFDHTNIKERKNQKLHIQHVPKRYWQYLTEKKIL
ncbi:TIGR03915 family putative DNA repair protein [Flavobacterium sp.]|uniref:TIGR03915 family putative DNA repair protein n=1 Tax=Flavobacterium sp. TaxID=239 RepID=UPI003529ACD8